MQTGKYRPGDESRITPPPAAVCTGFAEAVDLLLSEDQLKQEAAGDH